MSNYVTIHEEYKHKFIQIPKVFFTNEKYVGLSNNARVVWAMLRERASLSRKNNWYEKDTGRIYFLFTNKEMCEVTKIKSETTVTNIKKELVAAGLIEQKQRPNRPSILYLLYPIVEDNDIYEIDKLESAEHPEEMEQSQEGQGTTKIGVPNIVVPEPQKLVANKTDLSNTDFKDLDTLDTKPDFSITNNVKSNTSEKDRYLIESFFENDIVPVNIANCLKTFSNTLEEAEHFSKLIFRAKKAVEMEFDTVLWLDNDEKVERIIINSFTRALRKVNKSPVKNPDGYIYKSVESGLSKHFSEMQPTFKSTSNKDLFYNWLEERE